MVGIKGAIFDVDGTLLDSMWIWASVGASYLKNLGITPTRELFEALSARNGVEGAKYLQSEYGVGIGSVVLEDWRTGMSYDIYLDGVTLKKGVLQVLETLRSNGVRMCAATATDRYLVEPALRKCGISEYIGKIFTCGEEHTNKRSPDIFIRAAAFLGTDICDTLVIEDSLHALQTAKNAGFTVAGVYDLSSANEQKDIMELCDYYFVSMDEMLSFFDTH